jgi:hypothetical protein
MAGYRTTKYQPSAPDLRDENDLSDEAVALERAARLGDLHQRVPDGTWHLELIFVDQAGQAGQRARASSCSATCAIAATVLSTPMGNKITP